MLRQLRRLYARLTAEGSTEEEAIRGGIWVTGINVGARILQLLNVIILARLLSPSAFGLLGIALVALAALEQFSQLGFDKALVQHQDDNIDDYLNTAWVMKIARGALLAISAFVLAPFLAQFFGEPRSEHLIQALGFSPLILGLQNPAVVYFQKNLNFHKEFLYKIGGQVVDLIVAIAFAFYYRNVWALVAGLLAGRLAMLILSYLIHEYRPRPSFNLEYGREMFGFGKWLFLSSILVFLYGQGDDGFVGWFLGATALGYYQMAYRFSNAPATEVTDVISRVAFPTFSKVQNDTERLREGYFRVVHATTVIGLPLAAGIIAVAPQFVHTVLGSEWSATIPLIQLLAIWGAIRAFGSSSGALFQAIGRPDYSTKIQTIKVILLAIMIYPIAERFGLHGVAFAVVANALLMQPILIYVILSAVEGSIWRLLSLIFYPLFGSVAMAMTVVCVDKFLLSNYGIIELSGLVVSGVVTYTVIMLVVEATLGYEFSGLYYTFKNAM